MCQALGPDHVFIGLTEDWDKKENEGKRGRRDLLQLYKALVSKDNYRVCVAFREHIKECGMLNPVAFQSLGLSTLYKL